MSACCCYVKESIGPVGQRFVTQMRCMPSALDLGHCGDEDNPEPAYYCCKVRPR